MLRPLQRVRRPVSGSYSACRVDFVFPRRRLTLLCRKPRVLAAGCICAFEASCPTKLAIKSAKLHVVVAVVVARVLFTRCPLPKRLPNSTSFVDVPDETVMVLAVRQGCTATFLAKTAPLVNGRVDAQQATLVQGLISRRILCRARARDAQFLDPLSVTVLCGCPQPESAAVEHR